MTGRGGGGGRRVIVLPINRIFELLRSVSFIPPSPRADVGAQALDRQRLQETRCTDNHSKTSGRLRATVSIWLYEQLSIRIEGKIRGFDEFMNIVVDDAVEVKQITKTNDKESRRELGQILLKGDNVSLIQKLSG
ncbi:small nuclear ribonucleo E [Fusarium albosuccineum]|uniref:Small nuclear ribonucleoprotein E n=1 Tax=Fusarium albosuccineum TaxID=1237068 RepID=A0A8H4L3B0_9HYPO|nr:small nuclear ribonucleo E [Fusarium albosuccineum]